MKNMDLHSMGVLQCGIQKKEEKKEKRNELDRRAKFWIEWNMKLTRVTFNVNIWQKSDVQVKANENIVQFHKILFF